MDTITQDSTSGMAPAAGASMPPPPSPGGVPSVSPAEQGFGAPTAGMPATPEQMQELMSLIEEIQAKMGDFNATNFTLDNKSAEERNELLRQVFTALRSAGVDVSNPQAISDFVEQLRQSNPDLAQLFEDAMNSLLGEEPSLEGQDSGMAGIPQGPPGPPMEEGASMAPLVPGTEGGGQMVG